VPASTVVIFTGYLLQQLLIPQPVEHFLLIPGQPVDVETDLLKCLCNRANIVSKILSKEGFHLINHRNDLVYISNSLKVVLHCPDSM